MARGKSCSSTPRSSKHPPPHPYHMHGLVRQPDKERVGIRIRVHGHRLDAHALGRPDDAARNLAAICNEDLVKGLWSVVLGCCEGGQ